MTWLDLASFLLLCILWNSLPLYGIFPSSQCLATILHPSLIVVVFREGPEISEFQTKLQGIQFAQDAVVWKKNKQLNSPSWNVVAGEVQCFQQSTGSGRVMVVWGITNMKVKWLSSTKAQLGLETGCSLKICLFGESSSEFDVVFLLQFLSPWNIWAGGFIYKIDLWSILILTMANVGKPHMSCSLLHLDAGGEKNPISKEGHTSVKWFLLMVT